MGPEGGELRALNQREDSEVLGFSRGVNDAKLYQESGIL